MGRKKSSNQVREPSGKISRSVKKKPSEQLIKRRSKYVHPRDAHLAEAGNSFGIVKLRGLLTENQLSGIHDFIIMLSNDCKNWQTLKAMPRALNLARGAGEVIELNPDEEAIQRHIDLRKRMFDAILPIKNWHLGKVCIMEAFIMGLSLDSPEMHWFPEYSELPNLRYWRPIREIGDAMHNL